MSNRAAKIVEVARNYVGKKEWLYAVRKDDFGPNTYKCNKFVYDVLVEAGVNPPPTVTYMGFRKRPPQAGEWADPSVKIKGWKVVKSPQPGDVAAIAQRSTNATGHVAIVVGPKETVSASARLGGVIDSNQWGFREGETPTFRRYTPNEQ